MTMMKNICLRRILDMIVFTGETKVMNGDYFLRSH